MDNIKNIHGQQFIDCFYGYHSVLSVRPGTFRVVRVG